MMKRKGVSVVEYGNGDTLSYLTSLERLRRIVPFADATISTTLPRGGLQVVQPRGTDPARMRLYVREQHKNDVLAWRVMAGGRAARLRDFFDSDDAGVRSVAEAFDTRFLARFGLGCSAAARIDAPVLDGFPGVLHLFRPRGDSDFTSAEIRALEEAAEELNQAIGEVRARRRQQDARHFPVPAPNCRQLAMRAGGEVVFPPGTLDGLDEVMLRGLLESVARKLDTFSASSRTGARRTTRAEPSQANGSASGAGDRLLVADARGEHGAFRLSLFRRYPALTPGEDVPVAIVSLQPECESWGELRPSDFEADEELARLVPALQYMLQNYTGGSTLEQIARTAHLSPFHFHRRFTELLGITPKHYLFDCQVVAAKRLLASGELGLAEIAAHTGFAHQSHFTSRFKQATGLTPTRWRRLLSHSGSAAPSRTRSRGKSAGKRGD